MDQPTPQAEITGPPATQVGAQPQGRGSPTFRLAPHERREVYILAIKVAFGGLMAVGGLWLSHVDLGLWNAMLVPLAAGLTEAARKFFPDTRAPDWSWGPPPQQQPQSMWPESKPDNWPGW